MPNGTIDDTREPITIEPPEPFVAWPGWSHLLYAWALSLANGIWFVLVFGGCDFITAHRALRLPIHFAAELKIPFLPGMTAVYMSIYLLFLAGPFILRSWREFRAMIATLATMIGMAGVGFLLIPGQLAFLPPREQDLGIWAGMFHLADRLNLDYDLVPSLHVALSVACITAFCTHTRVVGRTLLWIWATAIALSTLLTHQHHVIDVVTGWFLATVCMRLLYSRLVGCGEPGAGPILPMYGEHLPAESKGGTSAKPASGNERYAGYLREAAEATPVSRRQTGNDVSLSQNRFHSHNPVP